MPTELILKQMEIGPMNNFQYFLGDKLTKEIAVVDPAWDVPFLLQEAKRNDFKIVAIFLTHGHPDHTQGVPELLKTHDVPVYICQKEIPLLKPRTKNLIEMEPNQKLKIGQLTFETFWTPGHSPGCQCFKYKDVLISGDALFIDGCGRCDLPGSDPKQMYHSLYDVIMKLPDSTVIYPGHNYGPTPFATLASQKQTNPYLQCSSKEEFLETRM